MKPIISSLGLILIFLLPCFAVKEKALKLSDIVPAYYDKLKPPKQNGDAVTVNVSVSILALRALDAQLLSYETDIFFHEYWTDKRLRFPDNYPEGKVVLDNKWKDDIWTPDIFFKNSRDGKVHNIIIPYSYMILNNKSEIFFACRLSLKLNCMMDLSKFPHDLQECEISIMSLQYANDSVILNWHDFYIARNTLLPQFKILDHAAEDCTKVYAIGTFSCLVGKIKLIRRIGYFLINNFIPSTLIVCMSFVTFWIPPTAYPARVTLSVTSILTIVTQQYQTSIASVSYVMAINIWSMGCIAFVFLTLLEYAAVNVFMDFKKSNHGHYMCNIFDFGSCKRKSWDVNKEEDAEITEPHPQDPPPIPKHVRIDQLSRIFFPLFFLIFFVTYWVVFSVIRYIDKQTH